MFEIYPLLVIFVFPYGHTMIETGYCGFHVMYSGTPFERPPWREATPSGKATLRRKSKQKCIDFYPWREATRLEKTLFWCKGGGLTRGVPLYMIPNTKPNAKTTSLIWPNQRKTIILAFRIVYTFDRHVVKSIVTLVFICWTRNGQNP